MFFCCFFFSFFPSDTTDAVQMWGSGLQEHSFSPVIKEMIAVTLITVSISPIYYSILGDCDGGFSDYCVHEDADKD